MTIFCGHCGKPVAPWPERYCQMIRPLDSRDTFGSGNDWIFYHNECMADATPPEHNMRGTFFGDKFSVEYVWESN